MFDLGAIELLFIAMVALVVIGPKDLPIAMRTVGGWIGKLRGMTRHFQIGIDAMIREAEQEEQEKKWAEKNAQVMRDHPPGSPQAGEHQESKSDSTLQPPEPSPVSKPGAPKPAKDDGA